MLPNHSPLMIAEQFGTLATMYPGRIDLGLGARPALIRTRCSRCAATPLGGRRSRRTCRELQGYLSGRSGVPGVDAVPGAGSNVPLYILGSSMFGAQLAALLGLPYAFASHFSPELLDEAIAAYRAEFTPSEVLDSPYVIAGVNVLAADTLAEAQDQLQAVRRMRAVGLYGRRIGVSPLDASDRQADQLLAAGMAAHVDQMLTFTAIGTVDDVHNYLVEFAERTTADELIAVHNAPGTDARLRSVDLLAEAMLEPGQSPARGSGLRIADF